MRDHVVIIGYAFGFPHGSGATARVRNYASGLQQNGVQVSIVCLKGTDPERDNLPQRASSGVWRGAHYIYTTGTTLAYSMRWRRWVSCLRGIFGLYQYILGVRSNNAHTVILHYNPDWGPYTFVVWLASRLAAAPYLVEFTEEPLVYERNSLWKKTRRYVMHVFTTRLYQGGVAISSHLESALREIRSLNGRILRLPVLADVEQIASVALSVKPERRVVYCGAMRDSNEVEDLLEIWSGVVVAMPGWKLALIGPGDAASRKRINDALMRLCIVEHVELEGFATQESLPQRLARGSIMVLARRAGDFSRAGMPNKLAEYCATGRPVVVSSTGDIPLYLEDGRTAFLVKPGENHAFCEVLLTVMRNMELSRTVGQAGQQVARRYWDVYSGSKILTEFIHGRGAKWSVV